MPGLGGIWCRGWKCESVGGTGTGSLVDGEQAKRFKTPQGIADSARAKVRFRSDCGDRWVALPRSVVEVVCQTYKDRLSRRGTATCRPGLREGGVAQTSALAFSGMRSFSPV